MKIHAFWFSIIDKKFVEKFPLNIKILATLQKCDLAEK